MVSRIVTATEAAAELRRHLAGQSWFWGVVVQGDVLEVLTASLVEAEAFIEGIGGRWSGYPVRPRRS